MLFVNDIKSMSKKQADYKHLSNIHCFESNYVGMF